jgi:ring-1,2-phenylacetyl-CoA epoxidase subunit PaaE
VLFAAGSGITPCLGIIRQALETEAATHVTLVYGNRCRDQAIFAGELDELKDRFLGRFEWLSVLSAEGEADVPLFGGRIDAGKVRTLGERLIDYAAAERIFVCGPGGMIKAVRDELLALGVPRETIAHEFFAPPGGAQPATPRQHVAVPAAEATHQVIIVVDGVRHRLGVNAGDVVLDVALAAGVKAPYACRGGMCSTCRCKVIEGRVEMRLNYSLEPWELERGFVLACQAVPATPAVTLDFDAM